MTTVTKLTVSNHNLGARSNSWASDFFPSPNSLEFYGTAILRYASRAELNNKILWDRHTDQWISQEWFESLGRAMLNPHYILLIWTDADIGNQVASTALINLLWASHQIRECSSFHQLWGWIKRIDGTSSSVRIWPMTEAQAFVVKIWSNKS